MAEKAAKTGCDAVKLQNYNVKDFITDRSLTYTYISQGLEICESQYEMFKRYQIDYEFLKHIKKVSDKNNIELISTPTSKEGVEDLVRLGTKKIKNGSDFLSNIELIDQRNLLINFQKLFIMMKVLLG